jgi:predicted DNA-binding transcriptional regulator AlpA
MNDLLTIREFCQAVRIGPATYFRLQASGEGPRVTRVGLKKVVIPRSEVKRWIGQRQAA